MIFRALITFAIAIIFSNAAFAATQCTFTTECYESETCDETNFTVTIEETAEGVALITDAGTIKVGLGGSDNIRVYAGVSDNAFHLLTHGANNFARYSTHIFNGPFMVNYLGQCTPE